MGEKTKKLVQGDKKYVPPAGSINPNAKPFKLPSLSNAGSPVVQNRMLNKASQDKINIPEIKRPTYKNNSGIPKSNYATTFTPAMPSTKTATVIKTGKPTNTSNNALKGVQANQKEYLNKLISGGGGKAAWAKAELKKMVKSPVKKGTK
jgi:hypothetical protein